MSKKKKELAFPLSKVKQVIKKWLLLEDDTVIDIIMAVLVANQLATDPLWLLIIGPPSHTKTELLRTLDGHKLAYFLSNLTPSTLVSGILPKKNIDDPSLLLKLDGKTLVLKDFTSILSMRSENQAEILGQLREIYDGQYTKAFGNGKVINWHGHVGLIGAYTGVYDRHYSVIGSLGDRFMLYRTPESDGKTMGLQAQKIVGKENEMRSEIHSAVHGFIDQFTDLNGTQFKTHVDVNNMIVDLACFTAYARCPVERDYRNQHIEYLPMPEGTPRLVKSFMQIGMGLTLVHGKTGFDFDVYEIIKKIGRDLLPAHRLKIIRYLSDENVFEYLNEQKRTKEIADAVNIPTATTRLVLEDLMLVGLTNRDIDGGQENSPYLWQLNEIASDMISSSEIFKLSQSLPF